MLQPQNQAQQKIIDRLITYQNPELMGLFQRRYLIPRGLSYLNLDDLFLEFKKFTYILFLVQTKQCQVHTFTVIKQLELLDEIWHQFILMTSDYHHFCFEIFGCYIHHEPDDGSNSPTKDPKPGRDKSSLIDEIDLVNQTWGLKTAQTWYVDLPRQTKISMVKKWLFFLRRK